MRVYGDRILKLYRHTHDDLADYVSGVGAIIVVRDDDGEMLSSEVIMLSLPHTMRPTLLDPLQQQCCNNILRGGETREQGVNVDVT